MLAADRSIGELVVGQGEFWRSTGGVIDQEWREVAKDWLEASEGDLVEVGFTRTEV